jgi:colicin import membrane protein
LSTPTVPVALQPRASDRPPREERWGAGAALSAVAHVALVAGLAWSVHWKSDGGETVEAELWSEVPQSAAPAPIVTEPAPTPTPEPVPTPPPPPPPVVEPPAPRSPDIVTEKDDRQKLAKKKLEEQKLAEQQKREKADQLKQDQQKADAQKKAEEQKLAKARADQMARMSGMLGTSTTTTSGTAARSSGGSAGYGDRVRSRVKPYLDRLTHKEFDDGLSTEVEIHLRPDGRILSRKITRASGNPEWDQLVIDAIDMAEVFPKDADGSVPPYGTITFKP